MRTMLMILAIAAATLSGIVDGSGPQVETMLGLLSASWACATAVLRGLVRQTLESLRRPWTHLIGRILRH